MAGLLDFGSQPSGGGGLLDFIANDPGSRFGLTMLAASSPKYGRGLMQALQSQDDMKRQAMQTQLLQSQIAENTSQNKQREQQMAIALQQQAARDKAMFGGSAPTIGASGATGGSTAGGSTAGGQQAGGIMALAQSLGIPAEAIQADYAFNGGKKIAELLEARSKPNWQNIGGNLVNTNAQGFTGGLQAGLSAGSDGRVTAWQPDGQGGLVVGAPRGALDTYRAYQGTQADFKPIKVYNPDTGREEYTSERNVVQPQSTAPVRQQAQYTGPGYAGGSSGAAAEGQRQIMQAELDKLPANHPDRPALMREMQRLGGGQAPTGNYAAGPSAAEAAAQEAARVRAVDTAKADVTRDTEGKTKVRSANENLTNADRAIELLKLGPTGSAIGALADRGAAVFGKSTPGGNIAAQLDIVSANMVKNVPRFEGPQSNIDVEGYKAAAGRVADRTLPVDQRIAAANEVKYFEQKAIRQAQGAQGGGASGSWDDKSGKPAKTIVKTGMYGGRRVVQYSDGSVDYAN